MEDNQNSENTQTQPVVETPQENVSFAPMPVKQKSKGGIKTFLGIFILIIFIVGGFLIFKDGGNKSPEPESTPEDNGDSIIISSPLPSSEPQDKTKVVISIENGTGIAGEAAYIRDILKVAGYSVFKVGNASSTDNTTTTVTFSNSLSEALKEEITAKLNTIYKEVTSASSSTQTDDVLIVTGLRKNATLKPSATPTATPSVSPSPTPTPTPTATP